MVIQPDRRLAAAASIALAAALSASAHANMLTNPSFETPNNWQWAMRWTPHTWSFTAIASSTTIEFSSLMNAQASPALDDINVGLVTTDVPPRAAELSLAIVSRSPAVGPVTFAYSL